jgi:hypothetical protein
LIEPREEGALADLHLSTAIKTEGVMTSRCTTFARSLINTAVLLGPIALTATSAAPALADSGPSQGLYIFPGVTDSGGANFTGVATAVHCFSFSPVQETIQYVARKSDGTIVANTTQSIGSFGSLTMVTKGIAIYGSISLQTGSIQQGVFGIAATSTNIVCTAQVMDAGATVPNGIELHGTRFNPISGSQE